MLIPNFNIKFHLGIKIFRKKIHHSIENINFFNFDQTHKPIVLLDTDFEFNITLYIQTQFLYYFKMLLQIFMVFIPQPILIKLICPICFGILNLITNFLQELHFCQ